jgi:hypothetical protein
MLKIVLRDVLRMLSLQNPRNYIQENTAPFLVKSQNYTAAYKLICRRSAGSCMPVQKSKYFDQFFGFSSSYILLRESPETRIPRYLTQE